MKSFADCRFLIADSNMGFLTVFFGSRFNFDTFWRDDTDLTAEVRNALEAGQTPESNSGLDCD